MWTLVYMAAGGSMVETVCAILKENDIIYKLRTIEKSESENGTGYEILVPDAEVEKAQELIFEAEIN